MTTSFARALSPALASMSLSLGASAQDATLARHQALLATNSLAELVAMVPVDYREVLRPHLVATSAAAEKRVRMKDSLAKLVDLKGRDPPQFPASISTKVHEMQLTKEFAATDAGRKAHEEAAKAAYSYRLSLLDNDITARRANIAHIEEQLKGGRLIRPRGEYVGPAERKVVPLAER